LPFAVLLNAPLLRRRDGALGPLDSVVTPARRSALGWSSRETTSGHLALASESSVLDVRDSPTPRKCHPQRVEDEIGAYALGDTMAAYDTFADAASTGALKVVCKDQQ
jgi:hypothetical protein